MKKLEWMEDVGAGVVEVSVADREAFLRSLAGVMALAGYGQWARTRDEGPVTVRFLRPGQKSRVSVDGVVTTTLNDYLDLSFGEDGGRLLQYRDTSRSIALLWRNIVLEEANDPLSLAREIFARTGDTRAAERLRQAEGA